MKQLNLNKHILNFCQGSLPPGKTSWRNEYQRLTHETPTHLSETLLEHSDEVLDVSFTHDGKLFCTTSKDATVKVIIYSFKFIWLLIYTYRKSDIKRLTWPHPVYNKPALDVWVSILNDKTIIMYIRVVHWHLTSLFYLW